MSKNPAPPPSSDKQPRQAILQIDPPLIWPEPRWHSGQVGYENKPPFVKLLQSTDLISGVLVGVSAGTVEWLQTYLRKEGECRVVLIVLVYQAGPTREEHLLNLKNLQDQTVGEETNLELRVLPMARSYGQDFERMVMPPSVLQVHDSKSGKTWLCIGSVNDFGCDKIHLGSFNMIFQPDDAVRDHWRRWFQYLLASSAPLNEETFKIPHLVPAEGDPAAAEMWADFENACFLSQVEGYGQPEVNPETGEVVANPDGSEVEPWDDGVTALDPLAQKLQQVYANGWLVTVDETTRIKPLAIPVKAALLGQQSERTVGTVTHRQSFSLEVLDESVAREIENCRRVTDLVNLLTYPLSKGNRWLPETAKAFLDKELEARNQKGLASLEKALGGADVKKFIEKRQEKICDSLNRIYSELGIGETVPSDKLAIVLSEVASRLNTALGSRITPRVIYNKLAPPDLTASALDENWAQPFSLMLRAARLLRESLTDAYFQRSFKGVSFTTQEFEEAMDVFGDSILKARDFHAAREQISALSEIEHSDKSLKEKCNEVWRIISG